MKKSFIAFLSVLCLLLSLTVPAFAAGEDCVVLGADLTEEQIKSVYRRFGIQRGSVTELTVTNAEERQTLSGLVEESVIGKYAISCVYVRILPENSGLSVETYNVNWCTAEMYKNALVTAGVTDATIVVTAPFEVSGTAALTGIYKAYEKITGSSLDESAKSAGTRELTITGRLAEQIGELDATKLISSLKEALGDTAKLSDAQLREEIVKLARKINVTLSDSQIQQLIDLCRTLESLDPDALRQRVEDAQETIWRIEEARDKAVSFYDRLKGFFGAAADFLDRVKALFQ